MVRKDGCHSFLSVSLSFFTSLSIVVIALDKYCRIFPSKRSCCASGKGSSLGVGSEGPPISSWRGTTVECIHSFFLDLDLDPSRCMRELYSRASSSLSVNARNSSRWSSIIVRGVLPTDYSLNPFFIFEALPSVDRAPQLSFLLY
ncbi:hypothetical protein O6H91_16G074400 [Diphasiastrum complanatum]|uniref:Uncharacterized protein n=1 Tax=Diphasiastrum complanatum TaxID=34168 RepID=A0ACC2BDP8_DIPCM|nr:hypothetical protein O6H91_16G074400 [Diphasiastrum complanatum]